MIPHVDRPLVYIAAPYSSDPVGGTHRAIAVAERLEGTGLITPVVPHLNLLWDLIYTHTNDFWYSMDLALLDRCNALLRIPGVSPGADDEVIFAEEAEIEVFFEIDDLLAWAESFIATR